MSFLAERGGQVKAHRENFAPLFFLAFFHLSSSTKPGSTLHNRPLGNGKTSSSHPRQGQSGHVSPSEETRETREREERERKGKKNFLEFLSEKRVFTRERAEWSVLSR